jgi:hypothetical protein|tara:strand:- start:601 stop:807 length:207 start_codon:yes stop_codon:yes gene_type:complete
MDLIADLLIYASLFVTVSSAICAVTPTPKDNEFMGKYIYPVLETIALNIGKAKEGTTTNPIKFVKRSD